MQKFYNGLLQKDRIAQKQFYNSMSPKMLSLCRSYVKDIHFAEDCLVKGFVKIFSEIEHLQDEQKLYSWCKRIMINECLNYLRTHKKIFFVDESLAEETVEWNQSEELNFDAQEILDALPDGYRMVFNLFVIEEFSHKEIAKMLNISESTSKTQLLKARKRIKELLMSNNFSYKKCIK